MQWNLDYLARQQPVLPATDGGLARKVKPLLRVAERETAAYAVLRGIDYEVEECPMAAGNTINRYKEWLNRLEEESPGMKANFLFGFLERGS
ncbi:MAG: tRNA(Ile)-lysidine synthetase, partial [Actinobacteria bacterium]|nr:tRNA(Ile)-lysidine synthetase [Actinomycetota bacterium]